jgi:hypothetical protein
MANNRVRSMFRRSPPLGSRKADGHLEATLLRLGVCIIAEALIDFRGR